MTWQSQAAYSAKGVPEIPTFNIMPTDSQGSSELSLFFEYLRIEER